MTRAELIQFINANIYPNGRNQITAPMVRDSILAVVGFLGDAAVKDIGAVLENNTDLVTGGAVYDAIRAYLSSVMKMVGETTTDVITNPTANPVYVDGEPHAAQKGDVVVYGYKEFWWTGSLWKELGDEASWALKTITITGTGDLTGGGSLEANRTLDLTQDAKDKLAHGETAFSWLESYSTNRLRLKSPYSYLNARKGLILEEETDYTNTPADFVKQVITVGETEYTILRSKLPIVSDSFISAGGISPGGGASGTTLQAVWDSLTTNTGDYANAKIHSGHIPLGGGLGVDESGNIYVTSQGTVTGIKIGSTTYTPSAGSTIVDISSGIPTSMAWSAITSTPTTLAGYGITDAKIESGVITLGSSTITPLTSHQTIYNLVINNSAGTAQITYKPNVSGTYSLTLTSAMVGLGNVENTALSTWAGTSNITTLGTISTGVWQGTAIGYNYVAAHYIGRTRTTASAAQATLLGIDAISNASSSGSSDASRIVWDSTNNAWHFLGGIYADSFISAGGLSSGGGTSGIDLAAMWSSLQNNDIETTYDSYKFATAHLPVINAGTGLSVAYREASSNSGLADYIDLSIASGYVLPTTTEMSNKLHTEELSEEQTTDTWLTSYIATRPRSFVYNTNSTEWAYLIGMYSADASRGAVLRMRYGGKLQFRSRYDGAWEQNTWKDIAFDGAYVDKTGDTMTGSLGFQRETGLYDATAAEVYAYVSTYGNAQFGLSSGTTYIKSGATDLVHYKNGNSYTIWDASNDGSGSGLDADMVDGYHVNAGGNNPFGTIPAITTSGWMDVGKHFEFHYDNTTGSDYSTILQCTGNYGNIVSLPSTTGTLALTSDNVASATKLQTSRTLWGQSFDGTANVTGALSYVNAIYFQDISADRAFIANYYNGGLYAVLYDHYANGNISLSACGGGLYYGYYNTTGHYFYTGGTEKARMDSSGNVGIGISPRYKLDVYGAAFFGTAGGVYIGATGNSIDAILSDGTSTNLRIHNNTTGNVTLCTATNGGNVGIGTLSPGYKLDVDGDAKVTNLIVGPTYGKIHMRKVANQSVYDSGIYYDYGGYEGLLFCTGYSYARIMFCPGVSLTGASWDNSSAMMVVTTTGVGIGLGTSTPSYKLHVSGDIVATGAVTAGSASDARLKENIKTISHDSARDLIMALRPVTFKWNALATSLYDKYEGADLGFVAQEVEPLMPMAISTIFNDYKRLDQVKFIAPLVSVAQSHEMRIRELENEVGKLREENQQLKARLTN